MVKKVLAYLKQNIEENNMNLELKNFKYWLSAKDSNEIVGEQNRKQNK